MWLGVGATKLLLTELMVNCITWKNKLTSFRARNFNFNKFKYGGLHEKLAIAAWKFETM
jgi:hypothetical protein